MEKALVRILREGGARVRENVTLYDAGVEVDPADGRNVEIVATGLPIFQGIPAAIDTTMVSPLHCDGSAFPRADRRAGVALGRARAAKEDVYPELLDGSRLRLLVAAVEVGGRMNRELKQLLVICVFSALSQIRNRFRAALPECGETDG